MLVGLPVVSFLCAGLLGLLVPAPRIRNDTARLSFVCWLILCNLIHGVNSLVWSSNTDIHIPSWCDVVTNVLLGAQVALPGACLCLSFKLEHLSSNRPMLNDNYSRRSRFLFDVTFCVLLPILYMCLHLIVQDNRFDIVKDFGCSPSIHPSIPGLILIWLPPLFLCIISFILLGRSIHHSSRQPMSQLSVHLSARSKLSVSQFTRQLATILILTAVMTIFTLFSMFSRSLGPWGSWDQVHEHFHDVAIVKADDEVRAIELMWWGIPVISLFYIALVVIIGEEVRDAAKGCRELLLRWKARQPRIRPVILALPLHRPSNSSASSSRLPSAIPRLARSEGNFVSGWDDMLDTKAKRQSPKSSSRTGLSSSSLLRSQSQSGSSRVSSPEDDLFAASTLDYLHSPTAQSLGLHSPIPPPPPVYAPSISINPPQSKRDSETVSSTSCYAVDKAKPSDDGESVISSIIEIPWPQPPTTLSPRSAAHTRPHSPAYSDTSSRGALSDSLLPPFREPSISPVPESRYLRPISPLNLSSRTVSPVSKSSSPRKHLRRDIKGPSIPPGEVIYMTSVHESV